MYLKGLCDVLLLWLFWHEVFAHRPSPLYILYSRAQCAISFASYQSTCNIQCGKLVCPQESVNLAWLHSSLNPCPTSALSLAPRYCHISQILLTHVQHCVCLFIFATSTVHAGLPTYMNTGSPHEMGLSWVYSFTYQYTFEHANRGPTWLSALTVSPYY